MISSFKNYVTIFVLYYCSCSIFDVSNRRVFSRPRHLSEAGTPSTAAYVVVGDVYVAIFEKKIKSCRAFYTTGHLRVAFRFEIHFLKSNRF